MPTYEEILRRRRAQSVVNAIDHSGTKLSTEQLLAIKVVFLCVHCLRDYLRGRITRGTYEGTFFGAVRVHPYYKCVRCSREVETYTANLDRPLDPVPEPDGGGFVLPLG